MKDIKISTELIKLDQFLKLADIIGSGGQARTFIAENEIFVNNEKESRRGKKLRPGDTVIINGQTYTVAGSGENDDH